MLDNLANVDLSGIDGYIRYTYDNTFVSASSLIMSIGLLIFCILIGIGIYTLLTGTKSRIYRNELEDMYIAGKLKQFAKEDGIDLINEAKEFIISEKRRKLEEKSICNTIEQEIKEKIAKVKEDKLEKKK